MNPDNKSFINPEEEIAKNTAENKENKENKEYINLSFASVADLVKQIKEKGFFDKNEYQRFCEIAVIHNKITGKYDFWDFGSEPDAWHSEDSPESDGETSLFLDELPEYFKKHNNQDMKIFFCDSEYDTSLKKLKDDDFNRFFNEDGKGIIRDNAEHEYITPDGIYYKFVFSQKGSMEQVLYSDKKQLSLSQVKEVRNLLNKKEAINYEELQERFEI